MLMLSVTNQSTRNSDLVKLLLLPVDCDEHEEGAMAITAIWELSLVQGPGIWTWILANIVSDQTEAVIKHWIDRRPADFYNKVNHN